jgi:hypothetical protein
MAGILIAPFQSGRWLLVLCSVLLAFVGLEESQSEWKRITRVARGQQMPMSNKAGPSTPVRAARLIFEYDGDRVRLVKQMPVEIAAANLQTAGGEEVGVFVDIRDATNRTLARVPAPHAFSISLEVFPERHDEPITRTDVTRAKGAFTVVVPTPDQTDHATIVTVAMAGTVAVAGARPAAPEVVDLVSFPLRATR